MSYSTNQQFAMALIPKFSGSIGILSSLFIMSEILHDYRKGDMNPIKRALLGVTCFEICGSLGWFLSGWALPRDSDFAFANGTITSCNFQGFLLQFVIGAPMFNGMLQYLFFLLVKGKFSLKDINFIERIAYTLIVIYAFGTAFILLLLKQYNPTNQICWNNGYPSGCNESVFGGSDIPCERGYNAQWTGLILFYAVVWCTMIIIIYLNVNIFHFLAKSNSQQAFWVVIQGLLFSGAFAVTWTPSSLSSILVWSGRGGFTVDVLMATFEPLQGFWNMLILLRSNAASRERLKAVFQCDMCRDFISCIAVELKPSITNDSTAATDLFEIVDNSKNEEAKSDAGVPSK
jgi:hypothetical protein